MALPKIIYMMGMPGAGKGTQAELLAGKLGYHRFSTGDAFREVAREDSDLGRKVKNLIDNGFLAPPEVAAQIVTAASKKHIDAGRGIIFDGTPRTMIEAKIVDEFFKQQGYGRPLVIYLKVDKVEMIKRNSQRRFCLDIKGDFPVVTPADEAKCAELGGHVGQRPDDAPEKFATRWQQFMDRTYPVIEMYREENLVHEVDGLPSVPEVEAAVGAIVQSRV